jgi:hypothetical protein
MISEKICLTCGVIKSLTKFEKNKSTKDGRSPRCKKCHQASTRKYLAHQGAFGIPANFKGLKK